MSKTKHDSPKEIRRDEEMITLSKTSFLGSLQWIFLGVGGLCWLSPWLFPGVGTPWSVLIQNAGNILITGVLLGFISSHRHIKHFYRQDLNEVLFGEKFLQQRRDIADIWQKVSIALFKSRFPGINRSLMKTIQSTYLTSEYASYYEDFMIHVKVEWATPDKKFINVTDTIEYVLIADTDKEISFPQKNWIRVKEDDADKVYSRMTIFVDGEEVEKCEGKMNGAGVLYLACNLQMSGKTRYEIRRIIEKRYNIEEDDYLGYRATFLTHNLTVTVAHEPDMHLTFIERGTENDFKERKLDENCCEYRYKGLILPRQGYVILLTKKDNCP